VQKGVNRRLATRNIVEERQEKQSKRNARKILEAEIAISPSKKAERSESGRSGKIMLARKEGDMVVARSSQQTLIKLGRTSLDQCADAFLQRTT